MKICCATLLLVLCCALSAAAAEQSQQPAPTPEPCTESTVKPIKLPTVVKRGAPIGDAEQVAFADALKEPQKYAGRAVVIEGAVERVCKMEGCWMEIAPRAGEPTIRITFKDHGFFVPKDADGLKFRAVGEFTIMKLDKEMVEHLVKEDGAKVKTNPDGTADEVTFIATGVELWKQGK